jgi:hypothetical protein
VHKPNFQTKLAGRGSFPVFELNEVMAKEKEERRRLED